LRGATLKRVGYRCGLLTALLLSVAEK